MGEWDNELSERLAGASPEEVAKIVAEYIDLGVDIQSSSISSGSIKSKAIALAEVLELNADQVGCMLPVEYQDAGVRPE